MSSIVKSDSGFYTFTWTIRNFSFCHEKKGYGFKSPKFMFEICDVTSEWELEVYPHGHDAAGYIACDLRLLSQISITATLTISVIGADGLPHFSVERINQKFPVSNFSGFDDFVNRDKMFADKNFYLPKDTFTIRCEIEKRITEKPSIKHCCIRSEIGIKHISIPWDIKHFSSLQLNQRLKFPFFLNLEKEPHFEIHAYLDGDDPALSLRIDIQKESLKGNIWNDSPRDNYGCCIMMYCEASTLDSKGLPSLIADGKRYFESSSSNVVWKLAEMDLNTKRNLYLADDVLALRFQMVVSDGDINSLPAEVHATYPESRCVKPISTIKEDFKLLYQEQQFCDITLKTSSKIFKAHKAVLACRSPVFKAMFEHDMVENSSGTVNISDIDPKTLERMLFFIYADQVECIRDLKSAMQLFCAADKYQVNTLKECCYPIVKHLISAENVCEVLSFAHKYNDDPLKTVSKAFICKHPNETMESAVWERLMEENRNVPMHNIGFARCLEAPVNETESAVSISDAESDEDDMTMPKKKRKV